VVIKRRSVVERPMAFSTWIPEEIARVDDAFEGNYWEQDNT
jgi:hypothetical protein